MCGSLEQPGHLDASSLAFHSEVLSAVVGKLPAMVTHGLTLGFCPVKQTVCNAQVGDPETLLSV